MFSHLSVHHPEAYKEAKDQQYLFKSKPTSDANPIDLSSKLNPQSSVSPAPSSTTCSGRPSFSGRSGRVSDGIFGILLICSKTPV